MHHLGRKAAFEFDAEQAGELSMFDTVFLSYTLGLFFLLWVMFK